jgi:hypothetical protein
MKWTTYAVAGCLAVAGCNGDSANDTGTLVLSESYLSSGQKQGNFLTLRGLALPQSEDARERDTCTGLVAPCATVGTTSSYYGTVGISPNGSTAGGTIGSALNTLDKFKTTYGFGGSDEVRTRYYNRGDLGIGRDMHCVDKLNVTGKNQIACYVVNFAAGDDGSEFTFGLSSNIAFTNLNANHSFATVAMVYRDQMAIDAPNRVFFAVYNKDGTALLNAATLDRHGVTFNNEFQNTKPNNPGSEFGTPGVNFNNHIPSNCVSCHGGQAYVPSTHSQVGALFLPFDLDQFEYESLAGTTRAEQEPSFKSQNQMIRKVAALSVSTLDPAGTSIVNQLDTWYSNTNHTGQTNRTEVFEGNFNSALVIGGWAAASDIYQSVVRRECRNCHMSNPVKDSSGLAITFDTQTQFNQLANTTASFLCGHLMPHSLQTLREFWFSTAPASLASYFSSQGQASAATTLQGCGPADVATLDPPQAMASLGLQ